MGECFLKKAPAIWAVRGHVIMPVFKANKRLADQQFLCRLQVAESFLQECHNVWGEVRRGMTQKCLVTCGFSFMVLL